MNRALSREWNRPCFLHALIPMFLFVSFARAQTAIVVGHVTDPSGANIASAKVTATSTGTPVVSSTVTTNDGRFTLPFLQPGSYDITAEATGFTAAKRPNVKLDVDQTANLDFSLQIGSERQIVEVSAAAPLLQTETSGVGQEIENKTVVTLPLNGRDYTQLVTLSPGAAPNPNSRASNGFSLNGGSTLQTQITLDGTDNTNRGIGTDTANVNVISPSIDAIQEFKVETANYSAQYGRSAGGVVVATLKSGTNQFHGNLFEFLRNDAFDARGFFANRNNLSAPRLRRNQFGATLGGPMVRNKLFFF